jgi:hypothetical protein
MAQGVTGHKARALTDVQMDSVTAGGVSAAMNNGVVNFEGSVPTANGLVSASGSLQKLATPLSTNNMSTLTLNGGAQQNLSSLLNINSVNSAINVLMNLNVNINSTVGSIVQSNLNGKH